MDYLEWIPKRISELRMQKGVSAIDMSLSLGQSESYINRIENKRTLPSILGFLYICEYFNITPKDFFNVENSCPQKTNEVLAKIERLTPEQLEHILQIVWDIIDK